jgi:hypothetical protein
MTPPPLSTRATLAPIPQSELAKGTFLGGMLALISLSSPYTHYNDGLKKDNIGCHFNNSTTTCNTTTYVDDLLIITTKFIQI